MIEADLDLQNNTDYTIVALNTLANIEPLVLVDNNSMPAAGKAHVRFVHASPDAPAVDIAVTGGPVLFGNVSFKGVGDYLPVDAGTYDLEARSRHRYGSFESSGNHIRRRYGLHSLCDGFCG